MIDVDYSYIVENEIVSIYNITLDNQYPLFEWLNNQFHYMDHFIDPEVEYSMPNSQKLILCMKSSKLLCSNSICSILYELQKHPSIEGLRLVSKYLSSSDRAVRKALLWMLIAFKKDRTLSKSLIHDYLKTL